MKHSRYLRSSVTRTSRRTLQRAVAVLAAIFVLLLLIRYQSSPASLNVTGPPQTAVNRSGLAPANNTNIEMVIASPQPSSLPHPPHNRSFPPGTFQFHSDALLRPASGSNATVVEIEAFLRRRVHPTLHTLTLIPVNAGYVPFGLNLMCSLINVSRHWEEHHETASLFDTLIQVPEHTDEWESDSGVTLPGFVFVTMDTEAYEALDAMQLPVYHDPDVPFLTSKSAAWGDPKFHSLVCTKLYPVLRSLRLGFQVILSDADISFLKNPVPLLRTDVDLTFSIGSCNKDISDNFQFSADGIEKLNTGFYLARPTPAVIEMIRKALDVCRTSSLTGDQPAINSVLQQDWSRGVLESSRHSAERYTYGFFDGCLVANGCVYFKHLCANTTSYSAQEIKTAAKSIERSTTDHEREQKKWLHTQLTQSSSKSLLARPEPVLVHANFLVGKKEKIKHFKKYGLWHEQCVEGWLQRGEEFRKRLR